MKLQAGQQAPLFSAEDIQGKTISLKNYANKKVLLSFFRYAGCPFCAMKFMELNKDYPRLVSLGLSVITFFQSPKESVNKYIGRLHPPFPVIPDPDKKIANLYGQESSLRGWAGSLIESPPVIGGIVQGDFVQGKIDGDLNLLPADFLIGPPELTIVQAYYGANFLDKLSLLDIEQFLLQSPQK